MIKKRNLAVFFLVLLMIPQNAFAATTIYKFEGSALFTKPTYYPEYDKYIGTFNKDLVKHIIHRGYLDSSFSTPHSQSDFYSPDNQGNTFTGVFYWNCKDTYVEDIYYDANGQQVGLSRFYEGDIQNSRCTSSPMPPTNEQDQADLNDFLTKYGNGQQSSCSACEIFSCPGWDQYMAGLNDIKNAIPPAPNWQEVADTFNKTITPSVISDLGDLLGSVQTPSVIPTPPDTPTLNTPTEPAIPAQPSPLDDGGITPPTGQEDPGLGGSAFSSGDIKNTAPVIQERQDPTGGFKILDPIAGLPSQDEFKKNKPNEGTATLPANPLDGSNIAPNPKEGTNTAPSPAEGVNTAPNPKEDDNIAPIPRNDTSTATTTGPAPRDSTNTAPKPSGDSDTAPLPNESGTAPVPGQSNETAPIPGQ